jgi:hypothetical protein
MVTEQKVSLQSTSDYPNSSIISTSNPASIRKECWEIVLLVKSDFLAIEMPNDARLPIENSNHGIKRIMI